MTALHSFTPDPQGGGQALVRSLWRGVIRRPIFPREIVREVAERHGLTLEQITTPHSRAFARARWEAMAELRENTRLSLPQIGKLLGLRDHAAVIHGLKRYAELAEAA